TSSESSRFFCGAMPALAKHPPPARLAQLRGCEVAADVADIVHLRVRGREGDPRLEDEQDARAEQKSHADGPEEQGYPAAIEPGEGHDAEGDARRQKRAEAEVELRQRMLADTSPSRGATEIFEEHRQLSVIRLLGARELLELGEHFPNAVHDADE